MKVGYGFIQHGVDGDIELRINGKLQKLSVGDIVEVSVEPKFFKSDAKPTLVYARTTTSNGDVVYQESQTLSGATGKVEKMVRNKSVVPALEVALKEPKEPASE